MNKLFLITGAMVCLFCLPGRGQMKIRLQAAIDTAFKNNLSLKGDRLNAGYLQQIRGAAYNLPQTNAAIEYGQINSYYADNRISLSQTMKFPTVYARQKTLYEQEWKGGLLNVAVKENEVKKEITQVYYAMLYLREKQKLLEHSDSVFANFLKKAELRFNKGETNILEKATAETQAGQIRIQLKNIGQDFAILQWHFKRLLNTTTDFIPADSAFKMPLPILADTSVLQQHPYARQLDQEQYVIAAKLRLERSKLSPDLSAAFNTMTMKGAGADNKAYSGSERFQSVQVGVGIPLFAGAQKTAIEAVRINVQQAQNNYRQGLQILMTRYRQAMEEYNKNLQTVNYFETEALKNAGIILKTADQQFLGGEINYLNWVLLINNAIAIQSEYLDAVKNFNQSIIDINSLTNQ